MIQELEYKRNFKSVADRFMQFWKNEKMDRPLVFTVLPKEGVEPSPPPGYMSGYDGNYVKVYDQLMRWVESRDFLGDSLPYYYLEFCPNHFTALLGADIDFSMVETGTSWVHPSLESFENAEIKFKRESKWWQRTVELAGYMKERIDGRLLISPPNLVGGLDNLAAMRGSCELMIDMMDDPQRDYVLQAMQKTGEAYKEINDAFAKLFEYERYGTITRHGMYHKVNTHIPQCDISYMISEAHFNDFQMPYFHHELDCLEECTYHLDGKGAIRHLDQIATLDKVKVIQWQPGAGAKDLDWTPLRMRIDQLGKGQFLSCHIKDIQELSKKYQSSQIVYYATAENKYEFEKYYHELLS